MVKTRANQKMAQETVQVPVVRAEKEGVAAEKVQVVAAVEVHLRRLRDRGFNYLHPNKLRATGSGKPSYFQTKK